MVIECIGMIWFNQISALMSYYGLRVYSVNNSGATLKPLSSNFAGKLKTILGTCQSLSTHK